MPITVEELLRGAALPFIVAGLFSWLIARFMPEAGGSRYAGPVALVAGWLFGYMALGIGPLLPETHWHWLPPLMVGALILGAASHADGLWSWERLLLVVLAVFVGQWLLVPDWEEMDPTRNEQLLLWTSIAGTTAMSLALLSSKVTGAGVPLTLMLVMTCGAAVLGLSGNLRFAQSLGAGTAAMAGIALSAWVLPTRRLVNGIALPYTLLLAGSLLVGQVNSFSEVPMASYLLVALAPILLLPLCCAGCRSLGGWRNALLLLLPLVVAAIGVALAVLADTGSGDEW